MANTLLSRARRLIASSADELVSAVERVSVDALKREAVRDMEAAILTGRRQHARAARMVTDHERGAADLEAKVAACGDDAGFALARGRKDLAERAIARQLDLESEIAGARERALHARSEADALDGALIALVARLEAMVGGEAPAPAVGDHAIDPRILERADAAEAALARASELAVDAGAIPAIDALRREEEIARRLKSLAPARTKPDRASRPAG